MPHVYLRPYCVVHRSKTENSYMYSIIDEFHINICMKVHMVHNLNMILNIWYQMHVLHKLNLHDFYLQLTVSYVVYQFQISPSFKPCNPGLLVGDDQIMYKPSF